MFQDLETKTKQKLNLNFNVKLIPYIAGLTLFVFLISAYFYFFNNRDNGFAFFWHKKSDFPSYLQLKAPKDKILNSEIIGNEVNYTYISEEEVKDEILFYNGKYSNAKVVDRNGRQIKVNLFLNDLFYKDESSKKIFKIDQATTTTEVFYEQTKVSFWENILGRKALASNVNINYQSGKICGSSNISYQSARDLASSDVYKNTLDVGQGPGWWMVCRSFINFTIPYMDAISSASLVMGGSNDESMDDFGVDIFSSSYGPTADASDFPRFDGRQVGAPHNGTVLNNAWNTSSFNTTNTIDFNAAGLNAILAAKSSVLWLALVSVEDVNNSPPTNNEYVRFALSSPSPYLSLTYSIFSAPTVTTQAVSDIHPTTATGNGNVTSDGGVAITERGIVVSTSADPTITDTKFTAAGTTGAYTAPITGLTQGTHYHARAYAINSLGTSYGEDVEFTSYITAQATIKATNDGTLRGYRTSYATARNLATADFSLDYPIVGQVLFEGYYYVFRYFASFAIPDMASVTAASLFLEGNQNVSTADFDIYIHSSTYSDPLIRDDYDLFDGHQASGVYNGAVLNNTWNSSSYSANWNEITFNAAGLAAILNKENDIFKIALISKEDYDNSAPINDEWIDFNDSLNVSLEPYLLITYEVPVLTPTVTTQLASSLAATSAVLNGAISDTGGAGITTRGFKYGLTEADTWDVHEDGSFSTGSFSLPISNLTKGTTYYVRAYATNTEGTSYGPYIPLVTTIISDPVIFGKDVIFGSDVILR